jgi:hypothetical protein
MLAGGHALYTGLAALGLAITLLYGARFRVARAALPLALLLVIVEHATVNQIASTTIFFGLVVGTAPQWAQLLVALTLHGYLSSVLFITGVLAVAFVETRAAARSGKRLGAGT